MGPKRFGSAATANPDTIAISAVPRMSVQSNMGPRSHAQCSAGAGTVWTAWLTVVLRVVAPRGARRFRGAPANRFRSARGGPREGARAQPYDGCARHGVTALMPAS